jgi:hypothetical protein
MQYCTSLTDTAVDFFILPTITREQEPEILELLHLTQLDSTNMQSAIGRGSSKNHYFGFGSTDSHAGRSTFGCESIECALEVSLG